MLSIVTARILRPLATLDRHPWHEWAPEEGEHRLSSILTTVPSEMARPVHGKAMPVALTAETMDLWLEADVPSAVALQRPFPAERMAIVATGPRRDAAA